MPTTRELPKLGTNTKTAFWEKVSISGKEACWEWKGRSIKGRGYGLFLANFLAHRISYAITHGGIPRGLVVCHKCDNPKCVNPLHLFIGTMQDNVKDRDAKGRAASFVGENNGRAILSEKHVQDIRRRSLNGERPAAMAAEYGVHERTIWLAIKGKTWSHLAPELPTEPPTA